MEQRKYRGFQVRQRSNDQAVPFFVFAADPTDVADWSIVDRVSDRPGGIQRRISEARLRALVKFFTEDQRNVTPTSVTIAFRPGIATFHASDSNLGDEAFANDMGTSLQWGFITFEYDPNDPAAERPAFIVDGQHRLFSMAQVKEERLPILIAALLDAEITEQAFQFIVINNKATKVPADLVKALIVDFDVDELQKRLETARVSLQPQAILVALVDDDKESPFYQMVDWERRRGTGAALIKPLAIEDSLKYIRRKFSSLDEDQDALLEFFFAMWQGVKATYPELWTAVDNRLFENAGYKAMSEYLTDQLDTLVGIDMVDILEPPTVTRQVENILSRITIAFWQSEWKLKSLDTSAGRDIVKQDIATIRNNRRANKSWWDGLTLVDPPIPEEDVD